MLVVTPGEPSGVGPEILLKLAQSHPELPLLAVADPDLLKTTARSLNIGIEVTPWQPRTALPVNTLPCLPVPLTSATIPGTPSIHNANYVLETLRQAVTLVQTGEADALVTGPVHKAIINDAGIAFSGHTEFLAKLSGVPQVVMMLAAPGLRVTLVTTHLPLRDVAEAITTQKLEDVIRITDSSLRHQFGIKHPRLQILGLNPHAGEGGHLGHEDDQLIAPVIHRLNEQGLHLDGPVPADTAFNPPRLEQCDAVVAMYHDQGLPVLKHMGFGRSVNITLGLPFIRTSVDHGTALDIAGTGRADESSLYHAVAAALELTQHSSAPAT